MVKAEKKYIKKLGLRTVLNIQHFANYSTGALKDGRPVICFFDATQNPTGSWELADPDGVGEPYYDEENSSTKNYANFNPFFMRYLYIYGYSIICLAIKAYITYAHTLKVKR